MRFIFILWAAILLSACSIEGMVEKTVPEDVRANHSAHINSLLAKDSSRIVRAFKLDMTDEAVQDTIASMLEQVSEGKELRRDYFGVNSSSGLSTSEGKTRDISLVSEIQTEGGFMTVSSQYALGIDGKCCVLTNINVVKSDTSPMRESLEAFKKIAKIAGIIILLLIAGLVFFLVRRSRKKIAA